MRKAFGFALLSLSVLSLISCGGNHSSPTGPGPMPTPSGAHIVNVGQAGNNFIDSQSGTSTTTIKAGDTVQWVWVSGTHSTTSGNCCTPDGMWDSSIQSGGATFTRTFAAAGTFPYYCSVHLSAMTGTIMVNP